MFMKGKHHSEESKNKLSSATNAQWKNRNDKIFKRGEYASIES